MVVDESGLLLLGSLVCSKLHLHVCIVCAEAGIMLRLVGLFILLCGRDGLENLWYVGNGNTVKRTPA